MRQQQQQQQKRCDVAYLETDRVPNTRVSGFGNAAHLTRSPNVDLDFFGKFLFHVLMFLKAINITHIALMLIWILLE